MTVCPSCLYLLSENLHFRMLNISSLSGNWRSDNKGYEFHCVQMGADWNQVCRDQMGPFLKYTMDIYAIYSCTCRDPHILNKLVVAVCHGTVSSLVL